MPSRGSGRSVDLGHVHGEAGQALPPVRDELFGHERADGLLRLDRRTPDVRRENDVVEACERAGKRVAVCVGLVREHVDPGAAQASVRQPLPHRVQVHDGAARKIDENRALLHRHDSVPPEKSGIRRASVDVNRDDVRPFEELAQAAHAHGVADRKPFGDVVEEHGHAERFRDDAKLGADGAVADDSEGLSPNLVRAGGGFLPHAGLKGVVLVRQMAREGDGLGYGEFDHGTRVGVRRVEHGDACFVGGGDVDLVRSDAEGADGSQMGARIEHPAGEVGL